MNDDAPHILVVDDDRRLLDLLQRYLTGQGFRVTTAPDAETARRKLGAVRFALAVVDIMMPGESGLELTRSLRAGQGVPVLLLTAMNEAEDRVNGLASGAEDYLAKPFEPRELVLRIQNVLRRGAAAGPAEAGAGAIAFGRFRLDPATGALYAEGERVHLTESERALLCALAQRAGETRDRQTLCAASGIEGGERAVDVQITRLRRKIEPDPRHPRYLHTVRGYGYVLRPDDP